MFSYQNRPVDKFGLVFPPPSGLGQFLVAVSKNWAKKTSPGGSFVDTSDPRVGGRKEINDRILGYIQHMSHDHAPISHFMMRTIEMYYVVLR